MLILRGACGGVLCVVSVSAGTPVVVELPRDSTLELHTFSANTIFPYGSDAAFKLMVQAGDQRVGPGL
jgi:hypothetical protein